MYKYTKVIVAVVIVAVVIGIAVYYYMTRKGETYCTCTGSGYGIDKPVYPFYRDAEDSLPRCDLSASYNAGRNLFGWLQNSSNPYADVGYDLPSTGNAQTLQSQYEMGANELRDVSRDQRDGLIPRDSSFQYSFGAYPYTNVGACSEICAPLSVPKPRQFFGMDELPNVKAPPGACACDKDPLTCSCAPPPRYEASCGPVSRCGGVSSGVL